MDETEKNSDQSKLEHFSKMKDDLDRLLDDRPTFTLRKVLYIVGVAVLIIIILCIGLVVGLSKHPNYKSNSSRIVNTIKPSTNKVTKATTTKPTTPKSNKEKFYICKDANCYKAAARVKSMMSDEVTPCSNFYKWACGGWVNKVFISDREYRKQRLNILYKQHLKDLAQTLSSPIVGKYPYYFPLFLFSSSLIILPKLNFNILSDEKNWYEKHVKNIFQSCMDIYSREKDGAKQLKPYILKILNTTYLLDSDFNSKKKNMDLSHAIFMAHKELNVDVFINIELSYNYWKKKNVVYVGILLFYYYFFSILLYFL